MSHNAHSKPAPPPCSPDVPEQWLFLLYVAGMSRSARTSLANLNAICEAHLPDRHSIEIVDLHEQPERAEADHVLAVPMLIRTYPEPTLRFVGDLSTTEDVLAHLGLPLRT